MVITAAAEVCGRTAGLYRAGPVVESFAALIQMLRKYCDNAALFDADFGPLQTRVIDAVFGETADGRSCARYLAAASELSRVTR